MAADGELQDLFEDVDTLYEDLYEDVGDGRQLLRTSIQEMEERLDKLAQRDKEMEASLNDLQRQNESLQQEKSLLVRNISCLFKDNCLPFGTRKSSRGGMCKGSGGGMCCLPQTAQLEIARKDRNIKELREENELLKSVNAQTPAATHEKSRSRGLSVGARRNMDSNISARDHHPSSSERHSKEPRNELQAAHGKARDDVSRGRISSSPVREFRVRFEDQRNIDEASTRNDKRVHVSGSRERAQPNGRDRNDCAEPRRCTKPESERRDDCGADRTDAKEEVAERSKLRKLVPQRPSHRISDLIQ